MPDEIIITAASPDDLKLIVSALSAYQHNTRYRALYERLARQMERRNTDTPRLALKTMERQG